MTELRRRPWVPAHCEAVVQAIAGATSADELSAIDARLADLVEQNRRIHEVDCVNLNPAANVMNPAAEALLSSRIGSRPSLGYPGDKYEMGLEAIEQIEVIAAELAAEVFGAPFVEVRLSSGAMANLYTCMATAQPGDSIIVPPAGIGGHVTHHRSGVAGLYGLDIHEAPVDADNYTINVVALAELAHRVRPKLMSAGGSLNLFPHPVAAMRAIADDIGAVLLFDAAHLSGPIAGGTWPNPLANGAHVMTMSTYKSLGGPPSGLLVTNDVAIAERVDAIAFPGLTANFDAAKTAALAVTLLDWKAHGAGYANEMTDSARSLALALAEADVPVFAADRGATNSHAFAVDASAVDGGGHELAKKLRRANLLTSAIGLPTDDGGGLRIGTNETARWGMTATDMPDLAALIARAFHTDGPESVAAEVAAFRGPFDTVHFVR